MENAGKQTQVTTQIAGQNDALAELAAAVGKLEERLSSVLRPEADIKAQDEPQQDLVCLASQIRDNAHAVATQVEKVKQITSRLEL